MLILALDTSGRLASAAVCRDGVVLASCSRDSNLDHSRTILPVCRQMLLENGWSLGDFDAFAVTAGPGSFTGVRIGVAAVKGFAWPLDKPCAAVSTLLSAACAADVHEGKLCALVQARAQAQEYFYALFENKGGTITRLSEDAVAPAEEIAALAHGAVLCGDGAGDFFACLSGIGQNESVIYPGPILQNAASTARCACDPKRRQLLRPCHEITPSYLRIPQAERMRLEKLEKQV